MNKALPSQSRCIRAALFVLLLAAQSVAVAHDFAHWNHSVQETCTTCSLSSHLDGQAIVAHADETVDRQHGFSPIPQIQSYFSPVSVPYAQRAPPVDL